MSHFHLKIGHQTWCNWTATAAGRDIQAKASPAAAPITCGQTSRAAAERAAKALRPHFKRGAVKVAAGVCPHAAAPDAPPARAFNLADDEAAKAEGWAVFEEDDGKLRILRLDEPSAAHACHPEGCEPLFDSDAAAVAHVIAKARAGSPMHQRALALHTPPARMKRKDALALIAALGFCATYDPEAGEYRVAPGYVLAGGRGFQAEQERDSEARAYYTSDTADAVGTARDLFTRGFARLG